MALAKPVAHPILVEHSDERVDKLSAVDQRNRTTQWAEVCSIRIDSHQCVNCPEQIVDADGFRRRSCGVFIRRANDLSRLHAAAGKDDGLSHRPVIASGLRVDPWRAAHFSHHDDQCFVEETSFFKVQDKRTEGSIGVRNQIRLQTWETVEMHIPAGSVDADKSTTAFNQPPGQQGTLSNLSATVAVSNVVRFGVYIERLFGLGRRNQTLSLFVVR